MTLCTVEGCHRPLRARGWCAAHYARWSRTGSHLTVRPRYPARTLAERVADRVVVDDQTGCHVWQGATTAAGYGELHLDGGVALVHRAVYENAHGPIPPSYDIHHTCGNRVCCNPEHLERLTHAEHASLHHLGRKKS